VFTRCSINGSDIRNRKASSLGIQVLGTYFCILAQVHTWTLNAKLVLGEMLHMIVRRIEPGSCNLSLGNQAMANADAEHAIVCSQLSKDYVQVHDHYF
jgi:hypothetical protein